MVVAWFWVIGFLQEIDLRSLWHIITDFLLSGYAFIIKQPV
jgi:hypothetical protein